MYIFGKNRKLQRNPSLLQLLEEGGVKKEKIVVNDRLDIAICKKYSKHSFAIIWTSYKSR